LLCDADPFYAGKFHRWVGLEEKPETGGEDWDLE